MKKVNYVLILTMLFLSTLSCNKDKIRPSFIDAKVEEKNIDPEKLSSAIQYEVESSTDTSNTIANLTKHWYTTHKFSSTWINASGNHQKLGTLFSYLNQIETHGITARQLGIDSIVLRISELEKKNFTYDELAKLELKTSLAYIQYCSGLTYGFVNPLKSCPNHYYATLQADSTFTNRCFAAANGDLKKFLQSVQPNSTIYNFLLDEKLKLNKFKDSTFTAIPQLAAGEVITLGTKHSSISAIARRLMISGDLSNSTLASDYQIFTPELATALAAFKTRMNLKSGNNIDNQTIAALNYSNANYINKININLERLRWKPVRNLTSKYIHVNVADMTLTAFRADTVALKMRVCIGRPENRTPFLQSRIQEMVINPTWTIPTSIVVKEMAKIGMRDTSYFQRKNIRIYKNGIEVNPSKKNWAKVKSGYQPYKLVQGSGDINALGRLKFNFSNKFRVYLHDTNMKGAFRRDYRAVSHGCVRVEKPLDLAFFCLPDFNSADSAKVKRRELQKDKLRYSMDLAVRSKMAKELLATKPEKLKLKVVGLNPSVPVLINYQTCTVNSAGKVVFLSDIYNFDGRLSYTLKHLKLNSVF